MKIGPENLGPIRVQGQSSSATKAEFNPLRGLHQRGGVEATLALSDDFGLSPVNLHDKLIDYCSRKSMGLSVSIGWSTSAATVDDLPREQTGWILELDSGHLRRIVKKWIYGPQQTSKHRYQRTHRLGQDDP